MDPKRISAKDIAVSEIVKILLTGVEERTELKLGIPVYVNRRYPGGEQEMFRSVDSLYDLRLEGVINWAWASDEELRPSVFGSISILMDGDNPKATKDIMLNVCGQWNFHVWWNAQRKEYVVTCMERRMTQFGLRHK